MALNYPGPYTLKIFYTFSSLEHVLQLNTTVLSSPAPGTAFADMDIDDDILGSVDLETALDDLLAVLRPLFHSNTNFGRAELWKNVAESFEADFWSTIDISLAGTGATANTPAAEAIFVFRSYEGGVMKIHLEETFRALGVPLNYAGLTTAEQNFVNHIISGAGRYIARDTSKPFAFLRMYPGQSEAIFKKRYRP